MPMRPKAEKPATGSGSHGASGGRTNEGTAIYEELLEYYNSKIDALRQTRDALEDAKPMLTLPSTPPSDSDQEIVVQQQQQRNRAFVSLELLADMVDEMAIAIVFETFFEARRGVGVYTISNTSCDCDALGAVSVAENTDSDTHSSQGNGSDLFECPSCERSFPAARFASHMDKCMGLSGRRTATRSYDSASERGADRKRKCH
ncbi:hypothetical protein EV175_004261 [Coemansia sp. RSA 1933]|nr:hypothetical protein EV175_004261 [Coemansia sp. RSA 1933]